VVGITAEARGKVETYDERDWRELTELDEIELICEAGRLGRVVDILRDDQGNVVAMVPRRKRDAA
jgi:hypothetical protein